MIKCYSCGARLEESVELILHKGRTIPQRVRRCSKCGKSIVHIDEYEKIRSQLYPSFINEMRGFSQVVISE